MSLWKCKYCGNENEAATGICECGTGFGCQFPGGPSQFDSRPYLARPAQVRRMMRNVDQDQLKDSLTEQVCLDIREEARKRGFDPKPRIKWVPDSERHMLEIDVTDAHIGKLAWAEETGSSYDLKISVERVEDAVSDLLVQASVYPLERILLPWGNDFFHYDTVTGLTTMGTPQDRDSRYQKMFRTGRQLASRVVRQCASIAPVELVIIPGNHDEVLSFLLGEVLEAEFQDDPRVTVDNRPMLRKYVAYGRNLLGFTHGKDEPHAKLPLIMAQEVPDLWAGALHKEIHLGHLHTSKRTDATPITSANGVRVRILRSLSGTDAWHARKGYVGEVPGCEGFVWSKTKGLRANLFFNVCEDRAA
jgi:hypothetical protein